MSLIDWVDRFAVWEGIHPDLQTLLIYGAGIALYAALVFTVYQNISRRDPLHSGKGRGWLGRALHGAETVLTFPILSFGYFAVLSVSLFLMAKPATETAHILLLSMAAVLGVRVTAHLSELMSNDIAKLMPLSLLAVVLVDPGYLSFSTFFLRLGEAVWMTPVLLQYFVLFILVEAGMRGLRAFAPGMGRLWHRAEHRHAVSKRAMLRDIEHEHHGGGLFARHHEHAPRDRSRDFLSLDERSGGKPGTRQGVGPALKHEMRRADPEGHQRAPTPKAGPGGSGGTYSRA